jgi:hypothetical protein
MYDAGVRWIQRSCIAVDSQNGEILQFRNTSRHRWLTARDLNSAVTRHGRPPAKSMASDISAWLRP